jgi:hypothetical protein
MGIVQFNQVLTAHGVNLDPLLKEKAPHDFAFKREMWRGVKAENSGHRTGKA